MDKCRKATALLSKQYDQGKLNMKERVFINGHLLICPHCRRYKKQMDTIQTALKKLF
ncbi:zf-HC2 domain-containing protein [Neisseria sp. ZJ106]|uniref:Zf-HC2 domain-containing protein n=1 Tax=Neisseria lisongii TaxID=2912188 RepID=A0AAW5AG66_9NEIS|nr:zf-HC2 domain-containing protein [Neisseria lisongii]MCF7520915.1 zf-HC2 domain-containing protein [Neisseria lisongii]MCF7528943.1 zf-HC2 domain-containing protein [Neisseria lisongii]WCL71278.1 zf-HC2 domain-containing protein [Neisseria lisongii]